MTTFEPITVRYTLTPEIMFRAHNLASHKSKRQYKAAGCFVYGLLMMLAAGVVLLVVILLMNHGHVRINASTRQTLISAAVTFGFGIFIFIAGRKGWFVKKPYEQCETIISEDGIDGRSSSMETHYHWDHFTDVLENRYLLIIIARNDTVLPFPSEAFTAPEDRERLRALLAEKIGPVRWEDSKPAPGVATTGDRR
ncbi:MAG: YcxB family protein [Armatimonadota bacterium]